jgi:four helix bundle protein
MTNNNVKDYKDLLIWQKGIGLAKFIYSATGKQANFPAEERFGLVSQMRRAAVSVPSNIAEGQARNSAKDFARFLYMSKGSLAELDTQLTIAHELGFITKNKFEDIKIKIDELQRMIFSLVNRLGHSKSFD